VTRDVGEHCLVMGNPARVVDVNHDNTDLLGMPDAEAS
jgi:acetyltransferase-like isoleucine patch superfamily enzyme